jgi:hypothetical protein
MRSTFTILSAIVLCTLLIIAASMTSGHAQTTTPDAADQDAAKLQAELAGKIVVIHHPDGTTTGIENAKLRTLAGRRFVTGVYADSLDDGPAALKGSPVNASWDSLGEFLVLSPEQYRKWLDAYSE